VLGANGAGSVAEAGLGQDDVPVLMATLGKALGVSGAFVAGSAALVEGLQQFARTQIFTTAMPPALAAATRSAVRLARADNERRATLVLRITQFRHCTERMVIGLSGSGTPIQPIAIFRSGEAMRLSAQLEEARFLVTGIR